MKKVLTLFVLSVFMGMIMSSCNSNENKAKKAIASYVKNQEEGNTTYKILEYGELEEAPYPFTTSDVYEKLQEKRTDLKKEIKEKSGYYTLFLKIFLSDAEKKELKRIEEELDNVDAEINSEIEKAQAVWVSLKDIGCNADVNILSLVKKEPL